MKRQQILNNLLFASALCFTACSHKSTAIISSWQTPIIDGNASEWTHFQTGKDLQYTLANDATNLYVCVKTSDRFTALKIMRNALLIWFDSSGQRIETQGIRFPIPNTTLQPDANFKPGERPDASKMAARFRESKKFLGAIGLAGMPELPIDNYEAFGIKAAASMDDQENFTLECSLPFKLLKWDPTQLQTISLGLALEGMKMPDGQSGGGMPGGGGMPPGGGPGGQGGFGPPGGGSDSFEKMFEDVSLWRKFQLSKNNSISL
jgi:hypothetical protein